MGRVRVSAEEGHSRWTEAWQRDQKRQTQAQAPDPVWGAWRDQHRGPAAGKGGTKPPPPVPVHTQVFAMSYCAAKGPPLTDSHHGCYSKGSETSCRGETAYTPFTLPLSPFSDPAELMFQ